jgi:O-methyltransferase involved in polyketide biosynthesis
MTDQATPNNEGSPLILDPDKAQEILKRSLGRPQVARVYDYFLGGNANWAIDRELAKKVIVQLPNTPWVAQQNRQLLGYVVQYMLTQGVRQFVDFGSGLPTRGNVHEVAEHYAPGQCRVVYVDNDPVAAAHSYLLLEQHGDLERHVAIEADIMDYEHLMAAIQDHTPLDLTQPIGLLCFAMLHFIPDDQQPQKTMRLYRDRLTPGSFLGVSHLTTDGLPPEGQDKLAAALKLYENSTSPAQPRGSEEILRFLGVQNGWDLVTPPGLCWTSEWRTDEVEASGLVGSLDMWESLIAAGVSRKRDQ